MKRLPRRAAFTLSVRFVKNTVDRAVWRASFTRAGGEIMSVSRD